MNFAMNFFFYFCVYKKETNTCNGYFALLQAISIEHPDYRLSE